MRKTKVIIDTDPGVDDAFAIFLAHASEKLEILAMTTTAGNVGIDVTTRNAVELRRLLGGIFPIYRGAKEPLVIPFEDASDVHGQGGLGHYLFEPEEVVLDSTYAWDALYQYAKESGGVNVIALGPLTNIAIALLKYPDLPRYVDKVVSMGGTIGYGNTAPYSEFNYWCDPLAARMVFESDLKIEMVGLNATRMTTMDENEIGLLKARSKEIDDFIQIQKQYYMRRLVNLGLTTGFHLPDVLAVAAVINESIVTYTHVPVKVISEGGMKQGWTIVDLRKESSPKAHNVAVAVDVDKDLFLKEFSIINRL